MTQQMFSNSVILRSRCAVYDNNPLPVYSNLDNLKNTYRCALDDMLAVTTQLDLWKKRLGHANRGQWGNRSNKGATPTEKRAGQSECMSMINRLRARQRKVLKALAAAYDALSPDVAAAVLRAWEA